jgi:spermidine synthase
LWVLPLIIYLLTFVLVFARRPLIPHRIMVLVEPFLIIPLAAIFFVGLKGPTWQALPFHLLTIFSIAMVCHGELMESRPAAAYLTEFYLWISVGGVLGGIFNALLAPVLFSSVIEYPLIIVAACLLRPSLNPANQKVHPRFGDLFLPLALGVLLAFLAWGFRAVPANFKAPALMAIAGLAGALCYSFRYRPWRLALGVGVLILAGMWFIIQPSRVLLRERNFFGVAKVTTDVAGEYHVLTHGSTVHGAQSLDRARRREPLTYYHHSGPLGQVFAEVPAAKAGRDFAIVGLGTGSIACYGQAGQHFAFYEIDPAIERIARDPRYFTFLKDCPAEVAVILGDARLSLKSALDSCYDIMILDAFSSDAIPIHLVTREAMRLYLEKLKRGGILAFHISSRYLNLKPVLGNLAREAGLVTLARTELTLTNAERQEKKLASAWVVMARRPEDLGGLARDQRWQALPVHAGEALWTDDFSNILSVLNWSSFRLDDWIHSLNKPE